MAIFSLTAAIWNIKDPRSTNFQSRLRLQSFNNIQPATFLEATFQATKPELRTPKPQICGRMSPSFLVLLSGHKARVLNPSIILLFEPKIPR